MTKIFSFNKYSNITIWIDLDNSHHVPFFAPIIKELQNKGYKICLSARNYSQTVHLAQLVGMDFKVIGKHHGKNKLRKIAGLIYRSLQLLPFVFKSRPVVALSHGSRSQMIAAFLFRIPIVMFLDYEFIQTIPFVKPDLVFLPKVISKEKLESMGSKVIHYPGIKEDVYVPSFTPDRSILTEAKFDNDKIIIVLRPPAYEAHYQSPKSEKLFEDAMDFLIANKSVQTIILPRDDKQKLFIQKKFETAIKNKSIFIPSTVVDGLNLMWFADLVISGGGTMNREAAALGVPVYSIFRGAIGDVDKHLEKTGRLVLIKSLEDLKTKIKLEKRIQVSRRENLKSFTLQSIINNLEDFIAEITGNEFNNEKTKQKNAELSSNKKYKTR